MEPGDLEIRNRTYQAFVACGRAPTAGEVAGEMGVAEHEVQAAWLRLHEMHALVLNQGTPEIRMANPFSAAPTAHRVRADGRWWYANCPWDAFGICAALGVDGDIESSCPDCGDPLRIEVRGRRPDREDLLFHSLVPASHWWDDIAFT